MFYVIGLGLCDEKDITIRGLEVMQFPLGTTFCEI
jgi:diphthamide biosynthesis methyltransferase